MKGMYIRLLGVTYISAILTDFTKEIRPLISNICAEHTTAQQCCEHSSSRATTFTLSQNKNFLNMMKPANHIFLFRSIINYYHIKKNPLLLKKLQQQILLPITFDIYGRTIYEINSEDVLMKE